MRKYLVFYLSLFCSLNIIPCNLYCQNEYYGDHYPTTTMQYFTISKITSEVEFPEEELKDFISKTYLKRNLISLLEIPMSKWPAEAILFPHKILTLEATISYVKNNINRSKLEFKEIAYNNSILNGKTVEIRMSVKDKENSSKKLFNEFEKIVTHVSRKTLIPKSEKLNYYEILHRIKLSEWDDYLTIDKTIYPSIATGITKDSLASYFTNNPSNRFEGIYKSIQGGKQSDYTVGIVQSDSTYNLICLESNYSEWREGFIKGEFKIKNEHNVSEIVWYMKNFTRRKPKIKFNNNGKMYIDFFPRSSLVLTFEKQNDI